MSQTPKYTNRLVRESSPYLLQHAHNPVDWWPWGQKAFSEAGRRNCPIFLSVGYSTCYWCHVMERESFENPQVAADLNATCVCIKVDREQRPDVDQLYMTAVQLMTQSGGWPMSVFLTPEGLPFYGATYIPPRDWGGRPGLPSLLRAIEQAWTQRREEVEASARQLSEMIRRLSMPHGLNSPLRVDAGLIDSLVGSSIADYDDRWGGFGSAPKFPRQTLLSLLLSYAQAHGDTPRTPAQQKVAQMLLHTLTMMARGGIRDHLGGGFHRYSTDAHWLVPHFEIMLYDNALLLDVYARAAAVLERPELAEVAHEIARFLLREMSTPQGAFIAAFDAEVDGREGASYLWTRSEIEQILGDSEDARLFLNAYGVDGGPNFADPHGSAAAEANVLVIPRPLEELAGEAHLDLSVLKHSLRQSRQKLQDQRRLRKQPHIDDKLITSWNALTISALATAGQILHEQRYIDAAKRCAEFILREHRSHDGGLYHVSRQGLKQVSGFLDDYATLASALVTLTGATGESHWQEQAETLTEQMKRRFGSSIGAFYFTDASAEQIIVRQMVAADSPLPSGNAMAAMTLSELNDPASVQGILAAFGDALTQHPDAYSALVEAALTLVRRHGAFELSGLPAEHLRPDNALRLSARWSSQQQIMVDIDIAPGLHIHTQRPTEGLTPTHLSLHGAAVERIDYPAPTASLEAGSGQPVDIWQGRQTIAVHLTQPPAGRVTLVLQAQPCTDSACLAVERLTTELGPPRPTGS